MDRFIDLHTHSNMSDGSMTAREVIRHAKENGLAAVSLTDHDSVEGVAEAVDEGKKIGVEVVPGIEFSAKSETETHILAYYIDVGCPELLDNIEEIKRIRSQRMTDTCAVLNELGFDITEDEVRSVAPGGILCRAHFARVMADKGYVSSVKEAFDLYLASGRPAYCNRQHLSAADAVALTKRAGGLSFAAHLHLMRKSDEELYEFLRELKTAGLCGIEGYYTEYTPEMQDKYQSMAKQLGLIISGGTDFHAKMKPHISIGTGYGNLRIPYSVLENIKLAYRKEYNYEEI